MTDEGRVLSYIISYLRTDYISIFDILVRDESCLVYVE